MEALVILVLAIPILALLGAIVGFIALRRTTELRRRIDELETSLAVEAQHAARRQSRAIAEPAQSSTTPKRVDLPQENLATAEPPEAMQPPLGEQVSTEELFAPAIEATNTIEDDSSSIPTPPPPPIVDGPSSPEPRLEATDSYDEPPSPGQTFNAQPPTSNDQHGINWEQWIGVRGAAVIGGVVFAIAALLFFQYSIEHNLIPPIVRVIIGIAVGLSMIVASEWLVKRDQSNAANALAGAGAVTLYAALWAARVLYELIGPFPAFAMMALVTLTCGFIALRRESLVVAILGLFGGFTTPILAASNIDQPFSLFAYILLLDAGLLWLARQRKWSILAVLSLLGTAAHQALWIFGSMSEERILLGLAVLAVFAVVFMLLSRSEDEDELALWRLTRAAGLVIPFAFALHFASSADFGNHLTPLGILLALLSVCSCWLAHRQNQGGLALLAAGFSLGIMVAWFAGHDLTTATLWESILVCIVLGLIHHIAAELTASGSQNNSIGTAAIVFNAGMLAILAVAGTSPGLGTLGPWLTGWSAFAAILVRHSIRPGRVAVQLAAGAGFAIALFFFNASHIDRAGAAGPWWIVTVIIAAASVFQALALFRHDDLGRRFANHTAALTSLMLILPLTVVFDATAPTEEIVLGLVLVLGILAAQAATRLGSGVWYALSMLSVTGVFTLWSIATTIGASTSSDVPIVFCLELAGVLFFTFWPALVHRAFRSDRIAWYTAALSGPAAFLSLKLVWSEIFGDTAIAVLPIGLALLSLAAGLIAHRQSPETLEVRQTARVWFLAIALCFISAAIPLQLDKEWITIGWAINGCALLALWKHLDHPGLKYFGLALLAAASARLLINPEVLSYHERGSWRIVNWLMYTYWVPAISLIGSSVILAKYESARLRPSEQQFWGERKPLCSSLCGLSAIALIFVWINLAIADFFSTSTHLTLSFSRMPARDLTTSISWAIYALVLLTIGIRRSSSSLRWISLGLLMATIVKVFLHDLGELEDLYRVASLLGLAISLILVSLAYQRFVLRPTAPEDE